MRSSIRIAWRDFLYGCKNLRRWLPVIWKQREWDFAYTYELLLFKIRLMRERTERVQFYVGWEQEAKWMKVCERLLERIIEDDYIVVFRDGTWQDKSNRDREVLYKILLWRADYWWD